MRPGVPASVGEDYVDTRQGQPLSSQNKDFAKLAKGLKRAKDPKKHG